LSIKPKSTTIIPCSGFSEDNTYKFYNNKIILKTDTLDILYLNSSTFKTRNYSQMQIDNNTQRVPIEITYIKK